MYDWNLAFSHTESRRGTPTNTRASNSVIESDDLDDHMSNARPHPW